MHPVLPSLRERARIREFMDDPASDRQLLDNTLRQFKLLNLLITRVRPLLKRYVLSAMLEAPDRPWSLTDLGAGACETPAWLLAQAGKLGLTLRVTACDHDPRVIEFARRHYGSRHGLEFVNADVLTLPLRPEPDFVFANHLLHHLDEDACVALLRRLSALPRTRVLLCDIERSAAAYAAFSLAGRLLPRDSFALPDGLRSIRRSFRTPELQALLHAAGAAPHDWRIRRFFPARLILTRGL